MDHIEAIIGRCSVEKVFIKIGKIKKTVREFLFNKGLGLRPLLRRASSTGAFL